jgi:Tyrosine phosphatase family
MRPIHWIMPSLLLLALLATAVVKFGKPRVSQKPLDMSKNGVHGVYNLHNRKNRLVLFNFRAVEPGVLYRGSGFVRPKGDTDPVVFQFLRARNIRTVVSFQEPEMYQREQGYFNYWGKKTGHRIRVVNMWVKLKHAYDAGPRSSLHAAGEFITFMKSHKPQDGAVYMHCDAGKDRTGVVAAAYEMWRNQGRLERNLLWKQVLKRYLVSNALIARDPQAVALAGGRVRCEGETVSNFVCRRWLEKLRPELEKLAEI